MGISSHSPSWVQHAAVQQQQLVGRQAQDQVFVGDASLGLRRHHGFDAFGKHKRFLQHHGVRCVD